MPISEPLHIDNTPIQLHFCHLACFSVWIIVRCFGFILHNISKLYGCMMRKIKTCQVAKM